MLGKDGVGMERVEQTKEDGMSFKSVEKTISKKEGIPMKNAGAILANASRNASPAAKKANPALKRVKG